MLALLAETEQQIIPFLVNNVQKILPKYTLVEKGRGLPGNRMVDLHFKDNSGNDVFVECKRWLGKNQLGDVIDLYSAILNSFPEPKNPRFIVIAHKVDEEAKTELSKLNIETSTYEEFGIPVSELESEQKARRKRELTPVEARLVSTIENEKKRIVDTDSISARFGWNHNYTNQLLFRLEKKKWLDRISKGKYMFIPPEYGYEERFPPMDPLVVASGLIEPYYLSYRTANSHYGFTSQVPSTFFLATTKKKKKPPLTWRNIQFRFVTLSEEKFFGFEEIEVAGGVKVRIADKEKAIIDSVDKLRYGGGLPEVIGVIYHSYDKIDKRKIASYAERMNSEALCQKLGFILDFLASKGYITLDKGLLEILGSHVGSPIYLDRHGNNAMKYVSRWRVYRNADDGVLLSEIRIA